MGFIIISIIISVVIIFIAVSVKEDSSVSYLCASITVLGIVAGLFFNTGGYKSIQEVQTTELQPMTDQFTSTANTLLYVSVNSDNTYTFYTEVDSAYSTENSKAYVVKTIQGDNVTIIEEEYCQTPRVTEYLQNPNITFWSFAIGCKINSYVFYVPKGTLTLQV